MSSGLEVLDPSKSHSFLSPVKKINDGQDVSSFLSSRAYTQIMTFLFQLNGAMYPRHVRESDGSGRIQAWELGTKEVTFSHGVVQLQSLLQKLEDIIEEAPPDSGPQRFGNTSFRKWFQMAESQTPKLLEQYLPSQVFSIPRDSSEGAQVEDELSSYLLGSFGSAQRLDYGTGHELSFLAFLGCIWMLGGFPQRDVGVEERGIVLGVIEPYVSSYTNTLGFSRRVHPDTSSACIDTSIWSAASSRLITWSRRARTVSGVSTITRFFRTSSDLPNSVPLYPVLINCPPKDLWQTPLILAMLQRRPSSKGNENVTCILRPWASSTT